ncbi:MAG: putative metalloprotease CJM1_0395 family protein [Rhodospirillaceae bacterium]
MAGIGVSAYAAPSPDLTSYRTGGAPKPPVGSALALLDSRGPQSGTLSSSTSSAQQIQIDALKKRDTEVRAHEEAHQAAGGQYAGPPTYQYQKGPDGTNYAIGGEVSIDSSTLRNDPAGTIAKMQQVMRAALAPAQPSSQDMRVASGAQQALTQAESDRLKTATTAGSGVKVNPSTGPGTGPGTGPEANTNSKTNSAFVAQQIGADATAITGTAAAANGSTGASSGLLSPDLLSRSLAAYSTASGLGGLRLTPQLAVVA